MRDYSGIRFTSDGFDCALPVAIDSHSVCSYACLYCFSDNLINHREQRSRKLGQTSLRQVESFFSGGGGKRFDLLRKALRYDRPNANGYPAPVQLGAINDPCDHIERQQGWLLEFIKLAIKYEQPVRISTKGTVFQLPEYQRAVAEAPHLFWVAFSIITPDDELIEQSDRMAPNATEWLKTMKILSDLGCSTSLRFRPIMPGLSDSTPRYPEAYRVLIEKAAAAGAKAISYEVGFVPGIMTKDVRWRWQRMSSISGVPYRELYRQFGPRQACMRPPAVWTENIMHAIAEVGHKHDMTLGVSDPVWKQLTDTGCCCGILPDDPVFGNWEAESATNQLLIAKETGKLLGPDDITPDWAYDAGLAGLVYPGVGPKAAWEHRHTKWSDKLRDVWNNPGKERSPLSYFQGALLPDHRDDNGDLFYRYEGLKRHYPDKVPFWKVPPRIE
jgi:DNA repair photolyase